MICVTFPQLGVHSVKIIANPRKFSLGLPIGLFFVNFEATVWKICANNGTVNLSRIQRGTRPNAFIEKYSDWNSLSPPLGFLRFEKPCENKRCTRKHKRQNRELKMSYIPCAKIPWKCCMNICDDSKKYQHSDRLLSNQTKKHNNFWAWQSWWYATPHP